MLSPGLSRMKHDGSDGKRLVGTFHAHRIQESQDGELREVKVKVGWSWTLFLFSGFFGLPLFLRRLYIWGFVFLALWLVNLLSVIAGAKGVGINLILVATLWCLAIWMGIKGNEMTAKNYLEQGWRFAEPQSEITKFARGKWGILAESAPQEAAS